MGFYVRIDDLRGISETTGSKINQWKSSLDAVQKKVDNIINMDSFQGDAADSIKNYYKEVYALLMSAVEVVFSDFTTKYLLYYNGYYQIDSDIHAKLHEDSMDQAIKDYQYGINEVCSAQSSLQSTLNSIADIFNPGMPSVSWLNNYQTRAKITISNKKSDVISYENSILSSELKALRTLIENTQKVIRSYQSDGRSISTKYTSGDYLKNQSLKDLAASIQECVNYQEINKQKLEEAISQQTKVYDQLRAEYEAKLALQRVDNGRAQIIMGVGAGIIGGVAIIATAGTAVVVVGAVAGTCSLLWGASEIYEGKKEVEYGSMGDPYTTSFNPIRDTIFIGNQQAYDIWGALNLAIGGLCIPVGKELQGLKGLQAVKTAAGTIGKEIIKDAATGAISSVITNKAIDEFHIDSKTEKTLLNIGVNVAVNVGIDAAEGLTKSKIAKHKAEKIEIDANAGKANFEIDDLEKIYEDSIHNPDSDNMTLGKYEDMRGPEYSYIEIAKDNGDTYFDMGDSWDKLKNIYDMTDEDIFYQFNTKALQDALDEGKTIRFSHDPLNYPESALAKELKYILNNTDYGASNWYLKKIGDFWYLRKVEYNLLPNSIYTNFIEKEEEGD